MLIRALHTTCALFLAAALSFAPTRIASAAPAEKQKVHVVVKVPAGTPKDAAVYLAGSLPSVGSWSSEGLKLARQEDGTYAGDLEARAGETLEYKITRGTWETVEKKADGEERENRSITIGPDTKRLDVTVERWADVAPGGGGGSGGGEKKD